MRRSLAIVAVVLLATPVWALKLTMSAKVEGDDRPVVVGATNLPDGTELMVTIRRSESGYMAQDKTRVSKGAFRAGPFSQKGGPLNPGTYTIEVSSPLASLQPPSVRSVIGREGSNLEGPLAKQSKFGGRVVEYQVSFTVGAGKVSPEKDRAARAQTAKDKHEWWLKSCKDNCNLVQGVARKRGEPFDWDRCYAKCLSEEPKRE